MLIHPKTLTWCVGSGQESVGNHSSFSLERAFVPNEGQPSGTLVPCSSPQTVERDSPICDIQVWWGCVFSGCLGDTQFSFRMRQCGGQRSLWHVGDGPYNNKAPLTLQVSSGLGLLSLCQGLLALNTPFWPIL